MNLHEYQSKKIFAEYGIPVPTGHVAANAEEAVAAARKLGGPVWVVKAQVHAGGRASISSLGSVKDEPTSATRATAAPIRTMSDA